jgi:hypothetical protein
MQREALSHFPRIVVVGDVLDLRQHGLCASSSRELWDHQEMSQAQDKRIKDGVARMGKP